MSLMTPTRKGLKLAHGALAYEATRQVAKGVSKKIYSEAKKAAQKARYKTPNKKHYNVQYDPVNRQSMRASMKRKGSGNIKAIKGKNKRVKVSDSLRKKIKKVIEEKKAPGTYIKTTIGTIGSCIRGKGSGTIDAKINGVNNQIAVVPMFTDVDGLGGQQVAWWGALSPYTSAATIPDGWDMCYFTPAKFLDAASILWNKKSMAQNPYVTTGNFQTETETGTGAPSGKYRNNLYVRNSYVSMEFKNNSQRTIKLLIRNCVPKVKFCEVNPLQAFQQGIYSDGITAGVDSGPLIPIPSTNANETYNKYMNDIDVPWTLVDNFKKNWKYETIEIIMAPGETCKHSIQGPKNMNINYNDLWKDGDWNLFTFYKKTSCSVVIGVLPDLVFASTTGTLTQTSGRWVDFSAADDVTIRNPISVEVKEHFDLAMPETTGFIIQDGTVGQTQQLNLRSKKYASWKFGANLDESNANIDRYDEEQPGTKIDLD